VLSFQGILPQDEEAGELGGKGSKDDPKAGNNAGVSGPTISSDFDHSEVSFCKGFFCCAQICLLNPCPPHNAGND
jgi:hypothetical protein